MAVVRIEDHEATVARRFLLRTLDPEEGERFEQRLLEDEALTELVEAVEDELLDAFVRDALPPDERTRAAELFADRPERIRFARALALRAARPAHRTRSRRFVAWAAAAVIVVLIGAGIVTLKRTTTSNPPAFRLVPVASRKVGRPLNAPAVEKVVAFTVVLVTTRDEAPPTRLLLPRDTTAVALTVRLHPADRYPSYELELRRDGIVAWHGRVAPATTNDLSVTIPAAALAPGSYDLAVTGLDDHGRAEDLGEQSFTVAAAPQR